MLLQINFQQLQHVTACKFAIWKHSFKGSKLYNISSTITGLQQGPSLSLQCIRSKLYGKWQIQGKNKEESNSCVLFKKMSRSDIWSKPMMGEGERGHLPSLILETTHRKVKK